MTGDRVSSLRNTETYDGDALALYSAVFNHFVAVNRHEVAYVARAADCRPAFVSLVANAERLPSVDMTHKMDAAIGARGLLIKVRMLLDFSQRNGRAPRDGGKARIHLLTVEVDGIPHFLHHLNRLAPRRGEHADPSADDSDSTAGASGYARDASSQQYFCKQVRRLMKERRVTQRTLARTINFDPSHLSRVLNGHRPPNRALVEKIDKALGANGEIVAVAPIERKRGRF